MRALSSMLVVGLVLGLMAGSTIGISAQEEDAAPQPPVGFTGVWCIGPEVADRDAAWRNAVSMSDPRLQGQAYQTYETHTYGELGIEVISSTLSIVNEEGAWVSRQYRSTGTPAGDTDTGSVFIGQGAYEGLIAFMSDGGTEVPRPEGIPAEYEGCAELQGVILDGAIAEPYVPDAVPEEGADEASPPVEPELVSDEPEPAFGELRVADVAELDERTRDLTIESPSVGEAKVRLLLPAGFGEDPDATYPVLYLLHGATQDYTAWTQLTDVEELTADLPLLVVMPEGGEWGWYSDWWNEGQGGVPAWETFHLSELRDILERDWRASDKRVIAGLSMGGYGAIHYATAHPELFEAVASFSGVVDPNGSGQDLFIDPMVWGDHEAQADVWAAHDPVAMAEALRGKPIFLSWGDGQPGPLDPPGTTADSYGLEAWVAPQNEALAARLDELGIPVTVETGPGAHEWPYWQQGLHDALPMLLEAVGE